MAPIASRRSAHCTTAASMLLGNISKERAPAVTVKGVGCAKISQMPASLVDSYIFL
jgi:hypothetical protein